MSKLVQRVTDRWRKTWASILLAGLTATASWAAAAALFGHARPTFAAIAAIVCLSPGLSSRGRQAVGMMVGVVTGVAIGVILHWLGTGPLFGIFAATIASMLVVAAFDINAVQIIQAGASALLVIAVGVPLGVQRLEDAGVGVILALLLSQVLLTPDPVQQIAQARDAVLAAAADVLDALAEADARSAIHHALRAIRASARLAGDAEQTRGMVRWTVRGRLKASEIEKTCGLVQPAAELASAVLLAARIGSEHTQGLHAQGPALRRKANACKAAKSAHDIAGIARTLLPLILEEQRQVEQVS